MSEEKTRKRSVRNRRSRCSSELLDLVSPIRRGGGDVGDVEEFHWSRWTSVVVAADKGNGDVRRC